MPAFREVERTYSSLSFLLPNKRIFGNEVLIQTPTFNFTASTMYEYFRRLDNPQAYLQWLDTRRTMDPFKHPDVDIVCIGGRGFNTMRKMVLTNDRSFFGGKKKKRNSKYKVPRKGRFPPPLPSDPIMTYRRPHHWHPYHRPPIAMQTLEPQNDWVASLLSMFSIALPSTLLFQPLPPSSNFMQIYRLRPIHGLYTYPAMPSIFSRHYLVPVISLRMTDSISTSESQLDLKSDSQLNHHRKQRRRFDASSNLFNSKARPHKLSKNEFRDRLFFQNYFLHQLQSNAIWSRFQSTPVLTRRQDNGKPTDRLSIYKINHGMNVDSKKGRYLYFSDGDGFVNIESFLGCLHWYDHPKHKFFFDIKRDSHLGLLRNVESVEYLVDVIMKIR